MVRITLATMFLLFASTLAAALERFALYDRAVDISQRYELSSVEPAVFAGLRDRMRGHWRDVRSEAPDWESLQRR